MHRIIIQLSVGIFIWFHTTEIMFARSKHNADSLKQVISIQQNDTNKVKTLLLLVNELRKYDPQVALQYCNDAYILSKDLDYKTGELNSRLKQSYIFQRMGKIDSAILCISDYKLLSESVQDTERIATSYFQLGNLLRTKGETYTAYNHFQVCLDLYKRINDTIGIICAYISIGIIHKNLSEFDSAAYYYSKALEVSEQIGYEDGIGSSLISLGKIYIEIKDYQNAINYLKRSIEFNQRSGNIHDEALAYENLGIIADEENDQDKAMEYYTKSLELNRQIKNEIEVNNLLNNIGIVYKKQKNYQKALDNFNSAISVFKRENYSSGLISAMINKATVLGLMGKLQEAMKIYDSCILLTLKSGEREKRRETYENIYLTYKQAGDFEKAFDFFEKYHYLNDSIYTIKKNEVINNLMLKYEKEKDQSTILILENENLVKDLALKKRTNQRNGYLYSGLGLVLIFSFTFIFYRQKSLKDKIIADQKILQLEEEKKLMAAHAIVNGQEEERKRIANELHDGLGVLLSAAKIQFSAIKDKSPENQPLIDKAAKLIEQAAGDVRKISHNMMPGILTKFGLYEAVEDLFENLNDTRGLNADLKIEGETSRMPENKEIMLYRIIQEMVNNTLKHAQAKNIRLKMVIQPNQLTIFYADDGKGFDLEEKIISKSFGLTSIQSRVKFINGIIEIKSLPGEGVNFNIVVPLT